MSWRETTHRWFVEYNPLYFASAGCVVAGLLLVSQELPPDAFASKLGVAGVTLLYEILLFAGAWLLLRAGQPRPAALLGLLALLFLLDAPFNGERLFSHARTLSLAPGMRARAAVPASLAFAALGPLKLLLLARIFRLRGAGGFLATSSAAVFLLPLLPYVVEGAGGTDEARRNAHVFVFWLGAPLLGWALRRDAWRTEEVDGLRVRRLARAVPFLLAAFFVAHAGMWSSYAGLGLTAAHAAPYVLVIFYLGAAQLRGLAAELAAWAGLLIALGAAAGAPGERILGATALLGGGGALALAWRRGLPLHLPGVVASFGGAYLLAKGVGTPGPLWWGAASLALLAAARDPRCLLASGAALATAVVLLDGRAGLLPPALAFAALEVAAVAWLLSRRGLSAGALAVGLTAGAVLVWQQPGAGSPWFVAATAVAFAAGRACRLPAFQAAGGAAALAYPALTYRHWSPPSTASWGLLLLVLGFAFLLAGVTINLRVTPARPRA